jgi:glycerol-3-phosphate dehydrogenase
MDAATLRRYREAVAADSPGTELQEIVDRLEAKGYTIGGEELKRVPPGYPADHPMADLLRWKDVVFGRRLSDAECCSPGLPDLLAEAAFAARREQAMSVGDVLLRRTRLGLLAAREVAEGGARRVAAVLGAERRWDGARVEAEVERWRAEAAAEGLVVGAATRPV